MDFSQLKKELDKGVTQSLYVFTGEEREVMRKYIHRIDPTPIEVTTLQSIKVRLQNVGLFNSKAPNTFVIRNDKAVLEMEIKDLQTMIGKDTLILVFDKVDERMKFFKAAKKSYLVNFEKFSDSQLIRTVQKSLNVSEDYPEDFAMLISRYCNNEVSRIENECHKIRHSGYAEYNLDVINELIEPPAEDKIFDMMKAVAKKELTRAWELYADLIALKESPIKIISILYTQFKQLFLIQSMHGLSATDIAAKTGLSIWQVNQNKDSIGMFDLQELIDKLKLIQKAEVYMKTGRMDIDRGMDNLLISLVS